MTGRARYAWAAAIAFLVVVVAVVATLPSAGAPKHASGAGSTTSTTSPGTTSTTTTTWPPLPATDTNVSWSDCGAGFECGGLTVPVSWSKPDGESLVLSLTRRPALAPDQRIGALVVNYGGPGEGGVDYLRSTWARLPTVVRQRFDVVSWDPRGTGGSRPIDCVDDGFLDGTAELPPVPGTAAELAAVRDYNDTLARGCAARMGAYAGDVGTRNTARDLEAIRRALGEGTLTYLGYSYGTVVGATYAQMFPASVRALVLDGPPDWWQPRLDYAYAQARGFMNALDAFLSWCEGSSSCALRRAGAPRDVLQSLITRTATDPIPATYVSGGRVRAGVLTGASLQSAVLAMLYDEARGWPVLGEALRSAAMDGWGGPLLSLADQYFGRAPDGSYSPLVEANAVIYCVDHPDADPDPPPPAQELDDVARFQAALAPWGGAWAVDGCRGMPGPALGDVLGDVRAHGVPPVLVVGTTGDPATPYDGAVALVGRIAGSGLLTFDSTEHTAFGSGRSTCVDDLVDSYLTDVTLPAPGTHCPPG